MKSTALLRSSVLLGLWLMLTLAAHAGSVNTNFVPVGSDTATAEDDMWVQVPLRPYPTKGSGLSMQFYVISPDKQTIIPNQLQDYGEITGALNRALVRWHDQTTYKNGRKFDFNTSVLDISYAPVNHQIPAFVGIPVQPASFAMDGYNVIDFGLGLDANTTAYGGTEPAMTLISYFDKDYPIAKQWTQLGTIESGSLLGVTSDGATAYASIGYSLNSTDPNPSFVVFIPVRDYKKGEIFDVDIAFNSTMAPNFHAWPASKSAMSAADLSNLGSTIDIEMVMMHQLGWAFGLGNSMIFDSVMYPYYNITNSQVPTDPLFQYVTDQFRKRQLSFDDQMTAGMAWNSDFPDNLGAISGQVLDGSTLGATTAPAATAAPTQPGLAPTTPAAVDNPFIPAVPVFIGVKPEQLINVPLLNGQHAIDTPAQVVGSNADNIASTPTDPADPNRGNWRMIAHGMTGQDLAFPASAAGTTGLAGTGAITVTAANTPPTVVPTALIGAEPGTTTPPDPGLFTAASRVNSTYIVPGLPPADATGKPVDYAVYLPATNLRTGNIIDFYFNPAQQVIPALMSTAAAGATVYTYTNEFYGGMATPFTFGTGNAAITFDPLDDKFMDNYIIGEMTSDGRIAAAINAGPNILSGFDMGPHSYVTLDTQGFSYNNHVGPIGYSVDPVIVSDLPAGTQTPAGITGAGATGSWQQPNKFKFRTQLKLSSAGGLVGIPAGIEVIHTVTNLSDTASTFTLRQVLDTSVFGRENPVYMVNNQYVDQSTSYRGAQIPHEITYQSWSTTETAIRSFVDITGGANTTPRWVTIGTLAELSKIIPAGGGTPLRDIHSASVDSGIALGWVMNLAPQQSQEVHYIFGFYPGGTVKDSWVPWTANLAAGTVRPAGEDDPFKIDAVHVTAGKVTDGIDIITNGGAASTIPATQSIPEGSAAGLLKFIRLAGGFPDDSDHVTVFGALGDLDNDGFLDVVTCQLNSGGSPNGQNHIFLNTQQINPDGSVSRTFRDATFGDDVNDPNAARLLPLHPGGNTSSAVLGDFDDDGWLDIIFINQGAPNRYYKNLGPEKPGYFVEVPDVLPPLINGTQPLMVENPSRAVAGDIDCDGDLDLIISELTPFSYVDPVTGTSLGAFIDSGDRRMHMNQDDYADTLDYTERVLINYKYTPKWAKNFNLDQRRDLADQSGTYFVDETWGSDDKPGTLTSLVTRRSLNQTPVQLEYQYVVSWDPSEIDRMPPVFPHTFNYTGTTIAHSFSSPMGASAFEPRLGPLFGGSGLDLMSLRITGGATQSPASITIPTSAAPNPAITGVAFINTGSVTGSDPTPTYGTNSAYFRNVDLFNMTLSSGGFPEVVGDGIPDGYFACMNYGMDPGAQPLVKGGSDGGPSVTTGGGLFVFEADGDPSSSLALFRYDAYPLFIGVPSTYTKLQTDGPDLAAANAGSTYAGAIGDWGNLQRPLPLLLPDNGGGAAGTGIAYSLADTASYISGRGVRRYFNLGAVSTTGGGIATQYWDPSPNPYFWVAVPTGSFAWPSLAFTRTVVGQPYGAASGDFDRDGDEDLFVVYSAQTAFNTNFANPKTLKEVFLNDSFGQLTSAVNVLEPNEPVNGMYAAVGDLDNDGDLDLVSFNAFGSNEAYLNQIYTRPPDPLDTTDPTMFYDSTYNTIPDVSLVSFEGTATNFPSEFRGVTIAAAIADLNLDGRPDIIMAEGGKFTSIGDFARVLINGGKPAGEGVPVFKPGGAAYPGPRQDLWIHNLVPSQGIFTQSDAARPDVRYWGAVQRPSDQSFDVGASYFEGYLGGPNPGFINDVIAGDVNQDGAPDLMIIRAGNGDYSSSGPQLVLNSSSSDPLLNNSPTPGKAGDAIFNPGPAIPLSDPGIPLGSGQPIAKNQGQKAKYGDFNEDGYPDVVIANGYPGDSNGRGAPNVILINSKSMPGHFTDMTEQLLPSITEHSVTHGLYDNTLSVVVGDFNSDGHLDIIFGNDATANSPLGFRLLLGDGSGRFTETPQGEWLPTFIGRHVTGMIVADIDGLGEPFDDKNHNGIWDPGESWTDLPTETEDLNGNGILDPGEDGLIGPPNGKLDQVDLNNDGIYTARRAGVYDGSADVIVSFDNDVPAILINDPTGQHPGTFHDEGPVRLAGAQASPNRGLDVGDINLDGLPDIVIAQHVGGITRPVTVWLNQLKTTDGHVKSGYFKDISYEVPYPRGVIGYSELQAGRPAPDDTSTYGWANDVKLLDMDGDGDLDMFVACSAAGKNQTIFMGSHNFMYVNRTVGAGFAFKGYDAQTRNPSPSVLNVVPASVKRGTKTSITVIGKNLQPSTKLYFGDGVTVLGTKQIDKSTSLLVSLDVSAKAAVGPRSVLVQNVAGSASASKPGLFNVYDKVTNEVPNRTWTLFE